MAVAYDNYLRLGCLDLIGAQAEAYARSAPCTPESAPSRPDIKLCCSCPGLDVAVGYPDGFADPITDEAPWYDPSEPLSAGFAGMIINSVTGLGPGRFTRSVTQLASGQGAAFGRGTREAPTITVTGTLIGASCCHVGYGLRWLRQALHGECDAGCPGEDLTYLDCCPGLLDGQTSTFGQGGLGTATATPVAAFVGAGRALNPNIGVEQGGGNAQPYFNGLAYRIAADTGPGPGSATEHFRAVGAILQAPQPTCNGAPVDGDVTITVTARMTNNGPNPVAGSGGGMRFARVSTGAAIAAGDSFLPVNMPAATSHTVTGTVTVPAADLAAGNVAVLFFMETWTNQPAAAGKGWTLDEFGATYAYDTTSCTTGLDVLDDTASVEAAFAPHWRTLKGVALVSDVEVIEQFGRGCGCGGCPITRVQFQLAASRPCVYGEKVRVIDGALIRDGSDLVSNCFEWVMVPDGERCRGDCDPAEPCGFDNTTCPLPPDPPLDPVMIDACLSCTPFEEYTTSATIPAAQIPAWFSGALQISVYAASQDLRHVTVRVFPNPNNIPADQLDPCSACSEFHISHVEAWSTVSVDGFLRRVTVTCPGMGAVDASALVGGPPGEPFQWPEVECGGIPYTVQISAQGNPAPSPDAAFTIEMGKVEC